MNDKMNQFSELIATSDKIVVIQADNPDADSLCSALALEQILGDLGKEVYLYCAVSVAEHFKYLAGWDRVSSEMPTQFDMAIIVDTSANSLLERLNNSPAKSWVASRPCVVLDHHNDVKCDIPYVSLVINEPGYVSTGDVIYAICKQLNWPINVEAAEFIAGSILADSLGLTTAETTATTYRTMAELIDLGVDRTKLEELRRAFNRMPLPIFKYKAALIERTEFLLDNQLAFVTIPQAEINTYSPLYNPRPLIQNEHLQTEGVKVSVVIKAYDSGRITGAVRTAYNVGVAAKIAQAFEGNGHAYAAGFKLEKESLDSIKQRIIDTVKTQLEEGNNNAAL